MTIKDKDINIFKEEYSDNIKKLFKKDFWRSPLELSVMIKEQIMSNSQSIKIDDIKIFGETNNLTAYLIRKKDIIIFSPFQKVDNSILMKANPEIIAKEDNSICRIKRSKKNEKALELPKVYLVNPSVKDVFPVPRLAISVSSLAAYLRKNRKAEVYLKDMQTGLDIEDIISSIATEHPQIIGISISFGQATLAEKILDKIYSDSTIMSKNPIIVIGNVISAFGFRNWFEKYPNIIICRSEGEKTIQDLVDYSQGLIDIHEVSGIFYMDNGLLKSTEIVEIEMDESPLPSMDIVEELFEKQGVLTMELSRGCSHSACSFCPRTHKPKKWKGMSSTEVKRQLGYYNQIFETFDVNKRIFMADEEFIGWMDDEKEAQRVIEICNSLIVEDYNLKFETNTRVDQIYNSNKDKLWHIERMKMIKLCKEAGLERLLVGIESGSNSVLSRYNKGIKISDSVRAIRILTALGIGLRSTFIMFDPLMNFSELKDNIKFLERRDVCLEEIDLDKLTFNDLYQGISDVNFIDQYSSNIPLYQNVSYMLVLLEVLMNSDYVELLLEAEKQHKKELLIDPKKVDLNMARHKVNYLDDVIGDISEYCQRWIDRHFAVDYCLKGLYKIADENARKIIFKYRAKYRELSFNLLKNMIYIFDESCDFKITDDILDKNTLQNFKDKSSDKNRKDLLIQLLDLFNEKLANYLNEITEKINTGQIPDENKYLETAIQEWNQKKSWDLINEI